MKQPFLALLLGKLLSLLSWMRRYKLSLLGMRIGKGCSIGFISINWSKNIQIGDNCVIQDCVDFRIEHPFQESNCIKIGDRVFIGRASEINCTTNITIGDDTMIASNTTIVDAGHGLGMEQTMNKQPTISEKIDIGQDVWIGSRCVILKGVSIGNGSVVGAGSVVNRSIPPYQIWAGVPARFIRARV